MEELEARRIRPSLSAMKVFEAELFRIIPSLASTAGHHRARTDDTAVRSAIATCATQTSRWALHYGRLGFDQKPRSDVITCFFPDVNVAKVTRGNCVQVGSLASSLPRMIADVATNMPVLILAGFAMLRVRVTCPDDPLLALRS